MVDFFKVMVCVYMVMMNVWCNVECWLYGMEYFIVLCGYVCFLVLDML